MNPPIFAPVPNLVGALAGDVETPAHMPPIIGSKGSLVREANVASSLVSGVALVDVRYEYVASASHPAV